MPLRRDGLTRSRGPTQVYRSGSAFTSGTRRLPTTEWGRGPAPEYDLFDCSYEDFRVLWLCLECNNLLSDLPMLVREESTVKEEEITKELYRDYSAFKRELFGHLLEIAPPEDALRRFYAAAKTHSMASLLPV